MELKELIKDAHENAVKHGFWDEINLLKHNAEFYKGSAITTYNFAIGNMLMLIVSEVAEAQDGLRKKDTDNFSEELADVAIRLADLCGGLGINLEYEIEKKMEKNKLRPYKHGKAF